MEHQKPNTEEQTAGWERAVLEKLAFAAIDEQKKKPGVGECFLNP
jgi:protease IV